MKREKETRNEKTRLSRTTRAHGPRCPMTVYFRKKAECMEGKQKLFLFHCSISTFTPSTKLITTGHNTPAPTLRQTPQRRYIHVREAHSLRGRRHSDLRSPCWHQAEHRKLTDCHSQTGPCQGNENLTRFFFLHAVPILRFLQLRV